jgi:hypothetical protein
MPETPRKSPTAFMQIAWVIVMSLAVMDIGFEVEAAYKLLDTPITTTLAKLLASIL